MSTSGVVGEEHSLPQEPRPEPDKIGIAKLLFGFNGLYERWHNNMLGKPAEARRYQDGSGDPDYNRRLRELEGQIQEIDREQRWTITNNEGGGGKWDKWAIPGLVTLAVSGIIGNVVQAMQVSALRQEVTDLKADVSDIKKLVEPRYRSP